MNASLNDAPDMYAPDRNQPVTIYFKAAGPHAFRAYHPIKYEGDYQFEALKDFITKHVQEPDFSYISVCGRSFASHSNF
jgi:hypothetical protein